MFNTYDREAKFADSPFAPYAKSEGFGLWAVSSSYFILKAIVNSEHNYFELAENYACVNSQYAERLYRILRRGMETSEKKHGEILDAIVNVSAQSETLPRLVIEISSDDSSE